MNAISFKCVAVGDGFVGKTSLLMRLCKKEWSSDYEPTVFDNYVLTYAHNGQSYDILFIDTAGQEGYDLLRSQMYDTADIFLVCFDVSNTSSFTNIKEQWLPELDAYSKPSKILIGTKKDLRNDPETIDTLNSSNKIFVTEYVAKKFANTHNMKYIECSSLNQENLQDILKLIVDVYNQQQSENKFLSTNQCNCVNPFMQLIRRTFCCRNKF